MHDAENAGFEPNLYFGFSRCVRSQL